MDMPKDGQFENTKETIGLGARGEKERKASNVDERRSGRNAAKAFGGRRVGRQRARATENWATERCLGIEIPVYIKSYIQKKAQWKHFNTIDK